MAFFPPQYYSVKVTNSRVYFKKFFFFFVTFSFFANIRYYYTEQKKPVGQILVGCRNIVQEKKNIQETISYSYLSREKYIQLIYSVR